jgi:hypothetical protein
MDERPKIIRRVIKDSMTGIDGQSYAFAKVLGCVGYMVFLALSTAAFLKTGVFNMQEFGLGNAAVITAMGAAIKLSETSEPIGKQDDSRDNSA